MKKKEDDMEQTTMRVTKRTARYVEYLKSLKKVRDGEDLTPDEIVWSAIERAFPDELRFADQDRGEDKPKVND